MLLHQLQESTSSLKLTRSQLLQEDTTNDENILLKKRITILEKELRKSIESLGITKRTMVELEETIVSLKRKYNESQDILAEYEGDKLQLVQLNNMNLETIHENHLNEMKDMKISITNASRTWKEEEIKFTSEIARLEKVDVELQQTNIEMKQYAVNLKVAQKDLLEHITANHVLSTKNDVLMNEKNEIETQNVDFQKNVNRLTEELNSEIDKYNVLNSSFTEVLTSIEKCEKDKEGIQHQVLQLLEELETARDSILTLEANQNKKDRHTLSSSTNEKEKEEDEWSDNVKMTADEMRRTQDNADVFQFGSSSQAEVQQNEHVVMLLKTQLENGNIDITTLKQINAALRKELQNLQTDFNETTEKMNVSKYNAKEREWSTVDDISIYSSLLQTCFIAIVTYLFYFENIPKQVSFFLTYINIFKHLFYTQHSSSSYL